MGMHVFTLLRLTRFFMLMQVSTECDANLSYDTQATIDKVRADNSAGHRIQASVASGVSVSLQARANRNCL